MRLSIVVAASLNNVIGVAGGLPWRLPEDLRRFKEITMGKPIVMGRATWDSIGRALPGRQNIVISRQSGFTAAGCDVAASVEGALLLAGDAPEVMVIGGGTLYRQLLPRVDRIYLTRVDTVAQGDTFFPELEPSQWREVARETYPASAERQHGFAILTLERVHR